MPDRPIHWLDVPFERRLVMRKSARQRSRDILARILRQSRVPGKGVEMGLFAYLIQKRFRELCLDTEFLAEANTMLRTAPPDTPKSC